MRRRPQDPSVPINQPGCRGSSLPCTATANALSSLTLQTMQSWSSVPEGPRCWIKIKPLSSFFLCWGHWEGKDIISPAINLTPEASLFGFHSHNTCLPCEGHAGMGLAPSLWPHPQVKALWPWGVKRWASAGCATSLLCSLLLPRVVLWTSPQSKMETVAQWRWPGAVSGLGCFGQTRFAQPCLAKESSSALCRALGDSWAPSAAIKCLDPKANVPVCEDPLRECHILSLKDPHFLCVTSQVPSPGRWWGCDDSSCLFCEGIWLRMRKNNSPGWGLAVGHYCPVAGGWLGTARL